MRFPGCGSAWKSPVSNSFTWEHPQIKQGQYNSIAFHICSWSFQSMSRKGPTGFLMWYQLKNLAEVKVNEQKNHSIETDMWALYKRRKWSHLFKIANHSNIYEVTNITCSALWQFLPLYPTGCEHTAWCVFCISLWNYYLSTIIAHLLSGYSVTIHKRQETKPEMGSPLWHIKSQNKKPLMAYNGVGH
jgi:hypothetical protein